jgi:hypothetical protein
VWACRKGRKQAQEAIAGTDDSQAQETANALLGDDGRVLDADATDRMIPMVRPLYTAQLLGKYR